MHTITDKKFYLGPKFGTLFIKKWITISELLQSPPRRQGCRPDPCDNAGKHPGEVRRAARKVAAPQARTPPSTTSPSPRSCHAVASLPHRDPATPSDRQRSWRLRHPACRRPRSIVAVLPVFHGQLNKSRGCRLVCVVHLDC
jgi:hypothetical protein